MHDAILNFIEQNKYIDVKNEITKMNIVDIAQLLEELDQQKLLIVFRILPKEIAAGVFTYISPEMQQYIIESITDKEIKAIIDELFLDDAVDFVEEMPSNVVKKVLRNTDAETRKLINQFLQYPEYSAGSIMTIEYVGLKKEMTVKQALEYIKHNGIDKETINTCYVTEATRKLEGSVSIRKLILSDESETIENIMSTDIIYVNTLEDQEKIASLFKKYDLLSMPVVDNERRLVGIVTIDDVVDIIDEEVTEDLHKMAAIQPSDTEYLKTKTFVLSKHRIIWLLILMISATFTGRIINKFGDILQSSVILASFIPMLMDTGGNAGSQSSTLIIRGLALGEIQLKDILKVLRKEIQVGLIVGFILSSVNFLRIIVLEKTSLNIAIVVSISLYATVILAKIVGGMLPIIAQKIKVDPAIMASPLITTIVDTFALTIYFSLATVFISF